MHRALPANNHAYNGAIQRGEGNATFMLTQRILLTQKTNNLCCCLLASRADPAQSIKIKSSCVGIM